MLHNAARFRVLRRGVIKISNLGIGSKIWCRRRSFAASVPSDVTEVKNTRKRVLKDERRAMVELSVNKYRSTNLGKFPTASYVMKEVGGSYYTVKKMVQELEYNSRLSSPKDGKETEGDDFMNSPETLVPKKPEGTEEEEHNQSPHDIDGSKTKSVVQPLPEISRGKPEDVKGKTLPVPGCEFDGSVSKAEEHQPLPLFSVPNKPENTMEEELYQTLPVTDGLKSKCEVQQPVTEISYAKKADDVEEETSYESVLSLEDIKRESVEHQSSPEYSIPKKTDNVKGEEPYQSMAVDSSTLSLEDIKRESVEHQSSPEYSIPKKTDNIKGEEPYQSMAVDSSKSKVEEHKKSESKSPEKQAEEMIQIKTSLWGNLKSVAEGIINIWRKQ